MDGAIHALETLTRVAFVGVALVGVLRWRRERSQHAAALAAAVSMLSLWVTGSWFVAAVGIQARWVDGLLTLSFAGAGFMVLIHRSLVLPLSTRWKAAAGVAMGTAVIGVLLTSPEPGATGSAAFFGWAYALLGIWLLTVGEPAVRVWRLASLVPNVRQIRLRLLSITYATLAITLVVLVTIGAESAQSTSAALVANIVGLGLATALYLSIDPPGPARVWWLRRTARHFAHKAAPVAAWYYDVVDDTLWWSPELRTILGVSADEPASFERFRRALHPNDAAVMDIGLVDAINDAQPGALDLRILAPDGGVRWVHGEGHAITEPSGDVSALFGTMQDITDHKRAQEQLAESLEAERRANERLREIDRMKSTFLSAVSHELRTPLTSIRGLSMTLDRQRSALTESQIDLLFDRILHNTDRLQSLLEDLLDLDRMERDALEVRPRLVNLAELVERVIEHIDMGDHPLHVDLPRKLEAALDPPRVERIVENLLVNVVRHTPAGTPVWVTATETSEHVCLAVEDAGPGVPADLRDVVLEPFRQGLDNPSRGTGVGLAIVSRFTELHGGSVRVEERAGGGASFKVFFPANRADPANRESRTAAA